MAEGVLLVRTGRFSGMIWPAKASDLLDKDWHMGQLLLLEGTGCPSRLTGSPFLSRLIVCRPLDVQMITEREKLSNNVFGWLISPAKARVGGT